MTVESEDTAQPDDRKQVTLQSMDLAMKNDKEGKVSKPVDLLHFG